MLNIVVKEINANLIPIPMKNMPTCPRAVTLSVLFLSIASLVFGQRGKTAQYYFPPAGSWEERTPESMGVNADELKEAVDFAVASESKASKNLKEAHYLTFGREPFGDAAGPLKERGPATGMIIKNGYIIAKWGEPERVDQTFSVAKSFLSTTVGLAFDRGLIRDLNDKVYSYIGPVVPYEPARLALNKSDAFADSDVLPLFESEHNRKISWDHLLRQTSDWEGTLWGKPDWADRPPRDTDGWIGRERNEPGSFYKYNDTRVNLLALCILNVWRQPLPEVLREEIMDPIGASPTWRWLGYENSWIVLDGKPVQSVSGGSHWGGGMFINAYDQARFGYLTLRNGNWNGNQLISEKWLAMARTPTPVQTTYGFMNFFLNTDKKPLPSAPASAFYHLGAGTNMIYVDQENDLLIVARWIDSGTMDGLIGRVLESMK